MFGGSSIEVDHIVKVREDASQTTSYLVDDFDEPTRRDVNTLLTCGMATQSNSCIGLQKTVSGMVSGWAVIWGKYDTKSKQREDYTLPEGV